MNEGIDVGRNIVVDDQCDSVDVNPTGCNIGGNNGCHVALTEIVENALTLILLQIAVQPSNIKAVLLQALNSKIDHTLGVAEDNALIVLAHTSQQTTKSPQFVRTTNRNLVQINWRNIKFLFIGHDKLRVVGEFVCSIKNLLWERCRKEQGLFSSGCSLKNPKNVRKETHIQHSIRFIKTEHLDTCEIEMTTLRHVHDTTRCSDDDVNTCIESFCLLLKISSPVNGHD